MPIIKYIEANGDISEVDVPCGHSLMQGAVDHSIDAIVAECGGGCSCATCHCYIEETRLHEMKTPDDMEQALLKMVMNPQTNSRLSCQIIVTDAMEGLEVTLPESQY